MPTRLHFAGAAEIPRDGGMNASKVTRVNNIAADTINFVRKKAVKGRKCRGMASWRQQAFGTQTCPPEASVRGDALSLS
jgi:hypothetical protein